MKTMATRRCLHPPFSDQSTAALKKIIMDGDGIEIYLHAVNEIQKSVTSFTISDDLNNSSGAIQIAVARLEDELRNRCIAHTSN